MVVIYSNICRNLYIRFLLRVVALHLLWGIVQCSVVAVAVIVVVVIIIVSKKRFRFTHDFIYYDLDLPTATQE